ncbi:TPA: hypothetical protein QBF58_004762 [Escherichia coli O11:H5]|uniref:hypothetical protein n=1 Tax=Escherichia coli TaxID=562 RepID=UPI00164F9640|nr:hypothetical protein [Escherichia coli]MDM4038265.1 hypothetical protein [Escherichia coli]HDQ6732079.1 hypothetical protein [Escherichia coli O11:H5]
MSYIKSDTPYPVYAQPSMIGNAMIEAQQNKKASLAMTTTSLLTAMSIACQNQTDVCRPGNLHESMNIYSMVLSDS